MPNQIKMPKYIVFDHGEHDLTSISCGTGCVAADTEAQIKDHMEDFCCNAVYVLEVATGKQFYACTDVFHMEEIKPAPKKKAPARKK